MYRFQHGDRPIDGYTILRGVGRGGFGEVYFAVSDAGREVALKMLVQNPDIELRGVRQCINLKSPHLVSIFDVRTSAEGVPFVIMEYVTGPSLRGLLQEYPEGLGPQRTAFLARGIAGGLSYLHGRGIVHRDLKPENIFFEDGYVKIGDYGLAKVINASVQSGQTISVGTVHYMAPEIGTGNYQRGVDIYALGIIIHELLTGEPPFQGDSFGEILMKHLTVEPDLERLDEPFRSVVDRALKKDPHERLASAEDLVKGLFDDADVRTSVASFDSTSLARLGARAGDDGRVETARAATVPVPAPDPRDEPARDEPLAGDPERRERILRDARRAALAARSQVRKAVAAGAEALAAGARAALQTAGGLGDPGPQSRPAGRAAPGTAARFFWVFVGSSLAAGALSCVAAPFVMDSSDWDSAMFFCCGGGMLGYSVFAFYRGLWAREPSFWRRTLRPFLVATGILSAAASVVCLLLGGLRNDDLTITSIALFHLAALVGFVVLAERLIAKWRVRDAAFEPGRLREQAPVPVPWRAWDLFLAAFSFSVALEAGAAGLLSGSSSRADRWEQWIAFGFAGSFALLARFFYRQAARARRGHFWEASLRPFLFTFVKIAVFVCLLPIPLGVSLQSDELMVLTVIGSVALGACISLLILKAPARRGTVERIVE